MAACGAKNAQGKPCQMPALTGTRRCWQHSGGKVAKRRKEAASRGGKYHGTQLARRAEAPAAPLRIASQADVTAALCRISNELIQGKLDPRSVNALNGSLALLLKPGLLTPTGAYEDFFEQFENVLIEFERHRDEGGSSSECFGILPGGARVRLTGDLERAAYLRLGMPTRDDGIDVELDGDDAPAARRRGIHVEVKRPRNPTVPPPEEETH